TGFETGIEVAKRGAKVILACRNEERAQKAVEKILKERMSSSMEGLMEDGLHPVLASNYFGHFLLTHLLMGLMNCSSVLTVKTSLFHIIDLLKKPTPSRVINVASLMAILYNFSSVNELNNSESYTRK
ncbi:hypothetical protein GWI33_009669, partial [Rhynchophorus ferrugineus]